VSLKGTTSCCRTEVSHIGLDRNGNSVTLSSGTGLPAIDSIQITPDSTGQ
jgi:hypothetical protein